MLLQNLPTFGVLRGGGMTGRDRSLIPTVAVCGVLAGRNDQPDPLAADAYGWPLPMETDEILSSEVGGPEPHGQGGRYG